MEFHTNEENCNSIMRLLGIFIFILKIVTVVVDYN